MSRRRRRRIYDGRKTIWQSIVWEAFLHSGQNMWQKFLSGVEALCIRCPQLICSWLVPYDAIFQCVTVQLRKEKSSALICKAMCSVVPPNLVQVQSNLHCSVLVERSADRRPLEYKSTIGSVQRWWWPPTTYGCSLNSPAFLASSTDYHRHGGHDDQEEHDDDQEDHYDDQDHNYDDHQFENFHDHDGSSLAKSSLGWSSLM